MLLRNMPQRSRRSPKNLIYIAYLEAAPWNQQKLPFFTRYGATGKTMILEAVAISREQGYGGRIGLHSLPQSIEFYHRLGLTYLFDDADYEGLPYFEYNPVEGDTLEKGNSP